MADAKITIRAEDLTQDVFDKLKSSLSSTGATVEATSESTTGFFSKLAGSVAVGELAAGAIEKISDAALEMGRSLLEALPEAIEHTEQLGASLYETSLRTGISVETLSKFRFVAAETGTDLDTLTRTIVKMQVNLGGIGPDAIKVTDSISKLHLNITDLRNDKPDEAFTKIVAALHDMPNASEKAAAGAAIFGRGWQQVSQLANEDFKGLMDEAQEMGLVMTTSQAAAAKAAEDAQTLLRFQFEATEMKIAGAFMPAIIGLSHDLSTGFKAAVDSASSSLDHMGGGDGILATVAKAMGDGDEAVAAQTQLYYMLRDSAISLVRSGIEPLITGVGFAMQEWDAFRVLLEMSEAGWDAIAYSVLAVDKQLAQLASHLPGVGATFKKEADDDAKAMDSLYNKMAEHTAHIDQLKKDETSWGQWSDQTNKSIEAGLKAVENSHVDVGKVIKDLSALSHGASQTGTADAAALTTAEQKHAEALQEVRNAITPLQTQLVKYDQATIAAATNALKHKASVEAVAEAFRMEKSTVEQLKTSLDDLQKLQDDGNKAASEALQKFVDDTKKQYDALTKQEQDGFSKNNKVITDSYNEMEDAIDKRTMSSYDYQVTQLYAKAEKEQEALDSTKSNYADAWEAIDADTEAKFEQMREAHDLDLQKMHDSEVTWESSFASMISGIPDLFTQAMTGGGGWSGFESALEGKLGSVVGGGINKLFSAGGALNGFANSLTQHVTDLLGNVAGDALGTVLPGIGNMLGPLIGKGLGEAWNGIKSLFGGVSQAEKDARTEAEKFQGTMVDLFNKTATDQEKVEAGGVQWKEVNIAVRDAYLQVGKTGEQAMQDLATLNDATHHSAQEVQAAEQRINDTIQQRNSLQDAQAQKQQMLNDAIQRYGFTEEQLGPTMQKQKLAEQSEQLIDDWQLLTESGISVDNVEKQMGSSIEDFVKKAIATGTEVPSAMQPMLEAMAQQGDLTDAAGNKITDLSTSGIKFGETLTENFNHVLDKLDELIDTISGKSPKSLAGSIQQAGNDFSQQTAAMQDQFSAVQDQVSQGISIPVSYDVQNDPNFSNMQFSQGGVVPEYFAGGGYAKGTDTVPAMLTPGEGVLTTGAMSRLGIENFQRINKGLPLGNSGLESRIDALHTTMREQANLTKQFYGNLPLIMRHAMRGRA